MDGVSAARTFANQLRQRLTERARLAAKTRTDQPNPITTVAPKPQSALATYIGQHGTPDHEARRALVEQLLADQFGPALLNQAKFQQIVDQVTVVMESDPELLNRMTQTLVALPAA